MKTLAFVIGFLTVVAIAAPRIAVTDSEPLGAEASLYLLGFLLVVMCATAFTLSAARRSISRSWLVAFCVGLLSSGIFYSAAAFVFPALSLGTVVVAGSIASVLVSWVVPRFFRPLPNNSFKPKPLRGSA